jgi:hypothetical protein
MAALIRLRPLYAARALRIRMVKGVAFIAMSSGHADSIGGFHP